MILGPEKFVIVSETLLVIVKTDALEIPKTFLVFLRRPSTQIQSTL